MVGHKLVGLRIAHTGLSGLYGISDQHFSIKAFKDLGIVVGYVGSYYGLCLSVLIQLELGITGLGVVTSVMDCYL